MRHLLPFGLAGALLAATCPAIAQDDSAGDETESGLSASAIATSEYIYRGVSQSDDKPALQFNLQYGFSNGLYAGLWGSNVDFGDSTDAEIDAFIGWAGDIAEEMNLDVQLVRYDYLDAPAGTDYAYNEVLGVLSLGETWKFTLAYTNDYLNSGTDSVYGAVGGEWPISEHYSLNAGVGYTTLSGPIDGYLDYTIGVSRVFGPVTVNLGYTGTNSDARHYFGRDAAEGKIGLTVTIEG